MRLVIKQAANKHWFYVMKARNGRVTSTSETYTRRRSAVRAAHAIRRELLRDRRVEVIVDA